MNKPTPKTYSTTNWSSYNSALINRGNISIWFDPNTQWYAQPQGKQGRNQTYSDTATQCCLMIKSLFILSLHMVTGFVQSLIKICVLNWTAPNYSTLCRRQKLIDIVIGYQKRTDGLHLLVDSTGLKLVKVSGNVRNMDLDIFANGINFILISMLKSYRYLQYSSLQIM